MITNFISMNGYGLFIWLSFSFTALACYFVYYKTKKTLKKYEKEFAAELEKLSHSEKKVILEKSKIANQILVSQNKII
jgi:heme exporter protein D